MSRLPQLEELLASEPNDVFLNFGLAMELAKARRYDESLTRFSRVIELDPSYISAYLQQAKVLLQTGDREEARKVLASGVDRAAACGDQHAKNEMEELLNTL